MNRTLLSILVALAWLAILTLSYRRLATARLSVPAMQYARTGFLSLFLVFALFAVTVCVSQRGIIFASQFEGVVEALGTGPASSGGKSPVIAFSRGDQVRLSFVDRNFDRYNYPNPAGGPLPQVGDAVRVTNVNGDWVVIQNRKGALVAITILAAFASLGLVLGLAANSSMTQIRSSHPVVDSSTQ